MCALLKNLSTFHSLLLSVLTADKSVNPDFWNIWLCKPDSNLHQMDCCSSVRNKTICTVLESGTPGNSQTATGNIAILCECVHKYGNFFCNCFRFLPTRPYDRFPRISCLNPSKSAQQRNFQSTEKLTFLSSGLAHQAVSEFVVCSRRIRELCLCSVHTAASLTPKSLLLVDRRCVYMQPNDCHVTYYVVIQWSELLVVFVSAARWQ
jgi:hypothetical protein